MNGESPSQNPIPKGASELLSKHEEIVKRRGRHPKFCKCGQCEWSSGYSTGRPAREAGSKNPVAPGAPTLPPNTALPQVMGSGASLFFMGHAILLDDPAWNISPEVKTEMGNILAWMLADDFYRMGGIGKYVVGGVLLLGVYVAKLSETAPLRKVKALAREADARKGASQAAAAPVQVRQGVGGVAASLEQPKAAPVA